MSPKTCYICTNMHLCFLRRKFWDVCLNETSGLLPDNFNTALFELIGRECKEFGRKENDD